MGHCFGVLGYACDGAAYCADCIDDPEGDEVSPIFRENEFDAPMACSGCGADLEVALSSDGIAYVAAEIVRALRKGDGERASDLSATYSDAYIEAAKIVRAETLWRIDATDDEAADAIAECPSRAWAEFVAEDLQSVAGAAVEVVDAAAYVKFGAGAEDVAEEELRDAGYPCEIA